jgi:mutator protein MutT
MKPFATIGVIVFKNNKKEVLLVKHGEAARHLTGSYGLPAGRIDKGETATKAAVRELQEETGITTVERDLRKVPYDFGVAKLQRKNGTMYCTWEVFVCRSYSGEIRGSGEETTPEWVQVSDLSRYWLIGQTETAIKEGLKIIK